MIKYYMKSSRVHSKYNLNRKCMKTMLLGKGKAVCTSNSILKPTSKSNYSEHFLKIQFSTVFRESLGAPNFNFKV